MPSRLHNLTITSRQACRLSDRPDCVRWWAPSGSQASPSDVGVHAVDPSKTPFVPPWSRFCSAARKRVSSAATAMLAFPSYPPILGSTPRVGWWRDKAARTSWEATCAERASLRLRDREECNAAGGRPITSL